MQVGGVDFLRVAVMPDRDQLDARERALAVFAVFLVISGCDCCFEEGGWGWAGRGMQEHFPP